MSDPQFVRSPDDLPGLSVDSRLAIDTEFHGERRYTPALHLVQMRIDDGQTWLLDAHDEEAVAAIAERVLNCTWIVHSGSHDLVLLARAFGGVAERVLDTQIAAGLLMPRYPAGLARLLDGELGIRLAKAETLSDWSKRPLTPEQIGYAAADVAHLHALWDRLATQARDLNRMDWVIAACDWARADALEPSALETAHHRIPGRQSLKPTNAAILQALAAWREDRARTQNQPPHSVLSNGVLLDLAKRAPTTLEELLSSRRAPRTALKRLADVLLPLIAESRENEPPRTLPPGGAGAARLAWLKAYAVCRGVEHGWGSRLVLPDSALERIALGSEVSEALTPWRYTVTGEDLDNTLAGRRTLTPPASE